MTSLELTDAESFANHFLLSYDCVMDEYTRAISNTNVEAKIVGWESLLSAKKGNVYRKVEPGWRAFLTSENEGMLTWTVKHPGARVKHTEVLMTGWATFRNGQLGATLVSGAKKDTIPLANEPFLAEKSAERVWGLNRESAVEKLKLEDVGPTDSTILTIQFADLEPNRGLDHDLDDAQVFRTPLNAPNPENLMFEIKFEQQEEEMEMQQIQPKVELDYQNQNGNGKNVDIEDVLSRKIVHLQMAEQSPPQTMPLHASNTELNGVHCFLLKYDCVRDQYRRPFNLGNATLVNGWQTLAQSVRGVNRMTEKGDEEFAYLGSAISNGEIVWRIEHPDARVSRVEVLISGMSTPEDFGIGNDDENAAKIGVDLICGTGANGCAQRRPDAIPFNAQRIDVMEMERVGPADYTEIRVNFQRGENVARDKPSQLFRAVFGEAATADDFVIRIEFEQPALAMDGVPQEDDKQIGKLSKEVYGKVIEMKAQGFPGTANSEAYLIQILLILGRIPVQMRQLVAQRIRQHFGMDLDAELRSSLPHESADIVDYLLHPAQQQWEFQEQQKMQDPAKHEDMTAVQYPKLHEAPMARPSSPRDTPAARLFDLEKGAELIYKAIARGGNGTGGGVLKLFKKKEKSDTEQILQILLGVNHGTRQLIAEIYKRRYEHEDLLEAIRKEVQDGPEKELILSLLEMPANLDAINLHKAIAGLGTNEAILIEILTSRDNAQLQAIKKAYAHLYNTQLETDVADDTSGIFRTLLLSLCAANRDESGMVKQGKVAQDAKSLYAGGEMKWGTTDGDTFVAILARENLFQLRALSEEYNQLTGHHLDEAIKKEFSGDARDGLAAVVRFARNPRQLFAEWIHQAIKSNKENDVIRLFCTPPNSGINLTAIAAEYQGIYGTNLAQALYDSKLHTKHALVGLLNRGGVL